MSPDNTTDRERQVLDVTFNSTPANYNGAWGWRIPRNPNREEDVPSDEDLAAATHLTDDEREVAKLLTEEEREVTRLAQAGTPQTREVSSTQTYTYCAPFNYPNAKVELGRPGTGTEFNMDGAEIDIYPYGAITIEEDEPIVGVTVIGSGCSTKSFVVMEAEPIVWKYPRTGVRMMQHDLWGSHVRWDAWKRGMNEDWNDAGLSSAYFGIPESRKVIIGGGSHGADPHYSVRIIRLDVKMCATSAHP